MIANVYIEKIKIQDEDSNKNIQFNKIMWKTNEGEYIQFKLKQDCPHLKVKENGYYLLDFSLQDASIEKTYYITKDGEKVNKRIIWLENFTSCERNHEFEKELREKQLKELSDLFDN